MRYAVTGASRGLGLALVQALLERGDAVLATVRDPLAAPELQQLRAAHSESLLVHACDVAMDASVAALGQAVGGPVDVLLNNAGVLGNRQPFEALDLDDVLRAFQVNTLGAVRVTRALLPALRRAATRKVVMVSSQMGADPGYGWDGAYAYRLSKAALNMFTGALANELRAEAFIVAAINPGWVRTEMGGPSAPLLPEDAARRLLATVDALGPAQSGAYLP